MAFKDWIQACQSDPKRQMELYSIADEIGNTILHSMIQKNEVEWIENLLQIEGN